MANYELGYVLTPPYLPHPLLIKEGAVGRCAWGVVLGGVLHSIGKRDIWIPIKSEPLPYALLELPDE